MTKKSSSKISDVKISECIIPEDQKSAIRNSPTYYDLAFHVLNIDLAKQETACYIALTAFDKAKNALQHAENGISIAKNNMNEFNHEMNVKHVQDTVQNKAIEIVKAMSNIGVTLSIEDAVKQAKTALNIQPTLTVSNRTRKNTLSITPDNQNMSTDNELINKIILEYSGAPIGTLPETVKAQFNRTTARKYSAVSCYYQQLQNKDGNGVIADIIRQSPDNETLLNAVNQSRLHETTISRFKHAFRLFTGNNS